MMGMLNMPIIDDTYVFHWVISERHVRVSQHWINRQPTETIAADKRHWRQDVIGGAGGSDQKLEPVRRTLKCISSVDAKDNDDKDDARQ